MLIRSKNKMHIVNIRSGVVSAEGNGTIEFRKGKIRIVLGEYSSLKKAIKVLDMIQEACADAELVPMTVPNIGKTFAEAPPSKENELLAETIEKALMNKMVFQMPEDSEVEV